MLVEKVEALTLSAKAAGAEVDMEETRRTLDAMLDEPFTHGRAIPLEEREWRVAMNLEPV